MIKPLPIISTHWPIQNISVVDFLSCVRKSHTRFFVLVFLIAFTSCKKIECKPEQKRPKLGYPVDRNPHIPNIPAPKGGDSGN